MRFATSFIKPPFGRTCNYKRLRVRSIFILSRDNADALLHYRTYSRLGSHGASTGCNQSLFLTFLLGKIFPFKRARETDCCVPLPPRSRACINNHAIFQHNDIALSSQSNGLLCFSNPFARKIIDVHKRVLYHNRIVLGNSWVIIERLLNVLQLL